MMMDTLLAAGQRLAEALRAENEALASLDLNKAADLAAAKVQASDAFAAAYAAAAKTGAKPEGPARRSTAEMATRLQHLGEENRRLLERAIGIQSKVIETIATAALPRAATSPGYAALGQQRGSRPVPPMAVTTRA